MFHAPVVPGMTHSNILAECEHRTKPAAGKRFNGAKAPASLKFAFNRWYRVKITADSSLSLRSSIHYKFVSTYCLVIMCYSSRIFTNSRLPAAAAAFHLYICCKHSCERAEPMVCHRTLADDALSPMMQGKCAPGVAVPRLLRASHGPGRRQALLPGRRRHFRQGRPRGSPSSPHRHCRRHT